MQQDAIGQNILVYSYQYFPDTRMTVVTEVDDSEQILSEIVEDQQIDAVPNPDEFDGWIVRYQFSQVPYHGFIYVPQDVSIEEGQELAVSKNSNYVSAEQNLLQTRLTEAPS